MNDTAGYYNVYITYPRGFGYMPDGLKSKIREHIVKSIKKNCSDEEWATCGAYHMIDELNFSRKALVYFGDCKAQAFVISEKFKADHINSYVTVDNLVSQKVCNNERPS